MQTKDLFSYKNTASKNRLELIEVPVSSFEVYIKQCTFMRIGIAAYNSKRYLPLGSDNLGYGYSNRGLKYHNGDREFYGEAFGANDIISVERRDGYLRFWKNGNDLGVAYFNIEDECVYVAISMYGECVFEVNVGQFLVYCDKNRDYLLNVCE